MNCFNGIGQILKSLIVCVIIFLIFRCVGIRSIFIGFKTTFIKVDNGPVSLLVLDKLLSKGCTFGVISFRVFQCLFFE